jgi:hypothetical protein
VQRTGSRASGRPARAKHRFADVLPGNQRE